MSDPYQNKLSVVNLTRPVNDNHPPQQLLAPVQYSSGDRYNNNTSSSSPNTTKQTSPVQLDNAGTDSTDVDVWNIDHSRYHGAKSLSFIDRFKMKSQQDPFVPIGLVLTTAALTGGLWSFVTGKRQYQQNFMWARVSFQGWTYCIDYTNIHNVCTCQN